MMLAAVFISSCIMIITSSATFLYLKIYMNNRESL